MPRIRRLTLALAALGTALGVGVWVFSGALTGQAEPWDAELPIWPLSWLALAVLGGLVGHVRGLGLPLGYALGQMLVTLPSVLRDPLGLLGWLFIAGYAALAAVITLALVGVAVLLRRRLRHRSGTPDTR